MKAETVALTTAEGRYLVEKGGGDGGRRLLVKSETVA